MCDDGVFEIGVLFALGGKLLIKVSLVPNHPRHWTGVELGIVRRERVLGSEGLSIPALVRLGLCEVLAQLSFDFIKPGGLCLRGHANPQNFRAITRQLRQP